MNLVKRLFFLNGKSRRIGRRMAEKKWDFGLVRKTISHSLTLFLYILSLNAAFAQRGRYFTYSFLPELPPNSGYESQPGLAGAYSGLVGERLIVAGGANFPDSLPWEGGQKVYHQDIFILQEQADSYHWRRIDQKFPIAAAYGAAVSSPYGLLCIGGNDVTKPLRDSWLLTYESKTDSVKWTKGPSLPIPLTHFATAVIDEKIYIAGGTSTDGASGKHFYYLDMSQDPSAWKWKALPPWEGKPRSFAVAASQHNGIENCLYLFSGRVVHPDKDPEVLYDAHVYYPQTQRWEVISYGKQQEFPLMAGTAFSLGSNTIIFPSAADGNLMRKERSLTHQLKQATHKQLRDSLQQVLLYHLIDHPGFGNTVYSFNTLTWALTQIDSLPISGPVTTTAIPWGDEIVIPSGEIRPGIRTPHTLLIKKRGNPSSLSLVDQVVMGLYFLILAVMGYFFSRRQKNTEDYFKGGGRIPWWAAGLSIFGTALSAITFMAVPAKTYTTDWSYFLLNMSIFLVAPLIIRWFIPQYRRLNLTTAYEYLEWRFNLTIRLLGSLSFILFQIGRMGVVLFLPAIALNVVSGIDIYACITLMGVVALIYTMFGGIEAVIWTDVMQVIVLLGGALLSLYVMSSSLEGGLSTILEIAQTHDKFNIIDLHFSLVQPTVWVMLIGGLFTNLITYGTDQTMVQRYLTTQTSMEANKSVWTNALLTIPASLLFFFIGTALFAFFKIYPAEINPVLANNDAIFPWYITSQLPTGIVGLLIAAIFAAAMSSVSSSMNSAATAWANDIHFRLGWMKQENPLVLARRATLFIGLMGIAAAILMATMDIKSLWDQFQKILGLVIGGLGGVFLLGILTHRAHSKGVMIGLGVSIGIQLLVVIYQPVHLILYAATGVLSCFTAGYAASILIPDRP